MIVFLAILYFVSFGVFLKLVPQKFCNVQGRGFRNVTFPPHGGDICKQLVRTYELHGAFI